MPYRYIPNFLSFSRIILAPIFVILILVDTFYFKIISILIFFIGSLSDFLDGYLARRFNYVTEIGKFIDPVADKILILSAFFVLNYFYSDHIELWMITVIVLRDVIITLFRYVFIKYKKKSMKTSHYGKLKTLLQIIVIHIILFFHTIDSNLIYSYNIFSFNFINTLMIICVLVTVVTGIHYLFINLKKIK